MLDIVQLIFPFILFSYCIVGPMNMSIYISPICGTIVLVNIIKIRDSPFSLFIVPNVFFCFVLKNIEKTKFKEQEHFSENTKIMFYVFSTTVFKKSFQKQEL